MRIWLIDPPEHFVGRLGELPAGCVLLKAGNADLDYIHLFCRDRRSLSRRLASARASLATDGMLWISWPKASSPLRQDLDQQAIRQAGLAASLVDVKVAAIDENWSALKFVVRLTDRK
jgi:hypothetical protein